MDLVLRKLKGGVGLANTEMGDHRLFHGREMWWRLQKPEAIFWLTSCIGARGRAPFKVGGVTRLADCRRQQSPRGVD